MGRGELTQAEIEVLRNNPYVLKVNKKCVYYSPEFKLLFIEEYLKGKRPTEIFREAGFDSKILGSKRIERACARWKKSYQRGVLGVRRPDVENDVADLDSLTLQSEQREKQEKDTADKCRQQEETIRKLRAESELLRQIRQKQEETGRGLLTAEICEIVYHVMQQNGYRGCISHLCRTAGISSCTFYKYRHEAEV